MPIRPLGRGASLWYLYRAPRAGVYEDWSWSSNAQYSKRGILDRMGFVIWNMRGVVLMKFRVQKIRRRRWYVGRRGSIFGRGRASMGRSSRFTRSWTKEFSGNVGLCISTLVARRYNIIAVESSRLFRRKMLVGRNSGVCLKWRELEMWYEAEMSCLLNYEKWCPHF